MRGLSSAALVVVASVSLGCTDSDGADGADASSDGRGGALCAPNPSLRDLADEFAVAGGVVLGELTGTPEPAEPGLILAFSDVYQAYPTVTGTIHADEVLRGSFPVDATVLAVTGETYFATATGAPHPEASRYAPPTTCFTPSDSFPVPGTRSVFFVATDAAAPPAEAGWRMYWHAVVTGDTVAGAGTADGADASLQELRSDG